MIIRFLKEIFIQKGVSFDPISEKIIAESLKEPEETGTDQILNCRNKRKKYPIGKE